ncbi:copper-binding protein [Halomonas sp. ANAO-440]|uniref:copper-binding protein n=1 Tax=Halomonas sp. ANAO-440 TaxID=2861360 RepID=UPI0021CD6284|nr:copper-binding protein [Halomonas sp. ANAO-440]
MSATSCRTLPCRTVPARKRPTARRPAAMGLLALALSLTTGAALAAGDLANRPERLERLVIGTGESMLGVSVREHQLETGQSYRLVIEATGMQECAWVAPGFFKNAWLRKIEVGNVEIKAPTLTELEFEREGEAELFFVPIRPGTYEWACAGLEERGVTGTFVVQ